MAVVNPVPKENAPAELHEIYDSMAKRFGFMPNFFAVLAHRPEVLTNFLPMYAGIMGRGVVDLKYKELAYLKTSLVNACEY